MLQKVGPHPGRFCLYHASMYSCITYYVSARGASVSLAPFSHVNSLIAPLILCPVAISSRSDESVWSHVPPTDLQIIARILAPLVHQFASRGSGGRDFEPAT
jgi:hypothetical protein